MKPLPIRILVWMFCVLLFWIGARAVNRASSKASISGGPTAIVSNRPLETTLLSGGKGAVRETSTGLADPRSLLEIDSLSRSGGRISRSQLIRLLSNAPPVLEEGFLARSLGILITALPELSELFCVSNTLPATTKTYLEPTHRRRLELLPTGRVVAVATKPGGNSDDRLDLEHPSDAAATEFISTPGLTNCFAAVRYQNKDVIIWNPELPSILARFTNVPPSARIAVSADGLTSILSEGESESLQWRTFHKRNPSSGAIKVPKGTIASLSPDGLWFAMASRDSDGIQILSRQTGARRSLLGGVPAPISLQWSPDGQWLAGASNNGLLGLWRADTGQLESVIPLADSTRTQWSFVPCKPGILTLDPDGILQLWNFWSGQSELRMTTRAQSYAMDSTGTQLILFRDNQKIEDHYKLDWSPTWTAWIRPPEPNPRLHQSVAWGTGDHPVLCVAASTKLSLWDFGSQRRIESLTMTNVLGVWPSNLSNEFMVVTSSGFAKWGPASPDSGHTSMKLTWIRSNPRVALDAAISLDGSTIALQHPDTVAIQANGRRSIELRLPAPAQQMELSTDGTILATSLGALGIQLFSTSSGSVLWTSAEKFTGTVHFDPRGREFLIGNAAAYQVRSLMDFGVRWEITRASPKELSPTMDVSQDGRFLACVGSSGQVRVFEGNARREWARLETSSSSRITQLNFSAAPYRLCALHENGRAEVWDITELQSGLSRMGLESRQP